MSRSHRAVRVSMLLAALAVVVGSIAVGGTATASTRGPDVDVVAHAGASADAPQNTLAAVRLAIEQGADVIENDFQQTADGELVVVHDTSLARTTDVEQVFPDRAPWNVGDFTLAEIKRLDAGSWYGPEYVGERVPTLRQWAVAAGDHGMMIEAKTPELYPGIEVELARQLRTYAVFKRARVAGRLVVMSFNHAWLRAFDERAPRVPVGLVFDTHPTHREIWMASGWADAIVPAISLVDELTIDWAHAHDMQVFVWTIDVVRDMRRVIRWGADGVITSYPLVLDTVLRRWTARN